MIWDWGQGNENLEERRALKVCRGKLSKLCREEMVQKRMEEVQRLRLGPSSLVYGNTTKKAKEIRRKSFFEG